MGLLDDAIREHLELKRLGGADPSEVAEEEQHALGPVRREGEATLGAHEPPGSEVSSDAGRSFFVDPEPTAAADSSAGQETVEINMEAELSGESDTETVSSSPLWSERATPVAHPAHTQGAPEESLEWEVPRDPSPDQQGGEPDRLDRDESERVEDVLEETPDFLRDTPEQERLWFEQRPPRDFDFNE